MSDVSEETSLPYLMACLSDSEASRDPVTPTTDESDTVNFLTLLNERTCCLGGVGIAVRCGDVW